MKKKILLHAFSLLLFLLLSCGKKRKELTFLFCTRGKNTLPKKRSLFFHEFFFLAKNSCPKLKYQYLNALPPMNSRMIERVGTASAGINGNASKNRRRRHASEYSRWEGVMHRKSGSAYIFKTESS